MLRILPQQLVLTSESHMLDSRFQIAIQRLQECIFLLYHLIFIKNFLHSVVVTLLSVKRKFLKFVLVLLKVENSLRQQDVGLDPSV